jgi:hypothetical protein
VKILTTESHPPSTAKGTRPKQLVEVKIAERLFDGPVFGFFQALGELARQHVFLGALGLDGGAELGFDGLCLVSEEPRRVVQIDRRRPHRGDVGEDDAEPAVDDQLGAAAGAIELEGLGRLF